MITATLQRFATSDEGTKGELRFLSSRVFTLELPWRDNARKISCIPEGDYLCQERISPKFGKTYHLVNVPGREFILLHPANFAGDVRLGFQSDVEGCIAPCRKIGSLRNRFGKVQTAGLLSKDACTFLTNSLGWKPFTLEIRNAF